MKIIFLLLIFMLSNISAKDLQNVSIQLHWLDQFQFAGYYVAKDKGFYKDVGLDVEIKKFHNDVDILQDIHDKKTNYAIGYSSLIQEKAQGRKIKLLYATFQSSPIVILALKSSNINDINDFTGKRMMTSPSLNSSLSINSMLNRFHISFKDLILQEHSFDVNDLLNKKTDLMVSYISNEPNQLKSLGAKIQIFDPKEYGFDYYSDILFTSDDELNNHKKRTTAFRKASLDGWKYAFDNIEETVDLILLKYNAQGKTREMLLYEADELKKLAYYKTKNLGCINVYGIKKSYDTYNLMGLVKNKINFDDFVFDLEQPKEVLVIDYKLIFIITMIFAIFLTIIYFRQRDLDKERLAVIKQKTLYKLVAESPQNAILMLDLEKLKYVYANTQSVKAMGYEKDSDIIGFTLGLLSPKYQDDGILSSVKLQKIVESLKTEEFLELEWTFKNKKGEHIWAEVYVSSDVVDDIKLMHLVWRDISKSKQANKELIIAKKRLDILNRSLSKRIAEAISLNRVQDQKIIEQARLAQMGELISMIAHQWRQPLNSIILTSSNLGIKCDLDEIDAEFFKNELNLINEYTHHLSLTIDDFRNFFKSKKTKESTNLNHLVKNVLKIVKATLESKKINLVFNNNLDNSLTINSFPNEIKQVILNIINNAEDALIEHNTNNPTITIETMYKEKTHILTIKDNAKGIDNNIIKKMFDPYFSTKEEKNGTGLGLYMSKTIIEEHCNGSLSAHNDNGAVFTIAIAEAHLDYSAREFKLLNDVKSLQIDHILLCEDSISEQKDIVKLFEKTDIKVDIANDAKETIKILESSKNKYKFVMINTDSPKLDGYRTSKLIKMMDKDIPIFAISSTKTTEDILMSIEAGACAHFEKPVKFKKLFRQLIKHNV